MADSDDSDIQLLDEIPPPKKQRLSEEFLIVEQILSELIKNVVRIAEIKEEVVPRITILIENQVILTLLISDI